MENPYITVLMVSILSSAGHRDVTDYRFSVSLTILILLSPAAMVIIFVVRRILLREIRKMVNHLFLSFFFSHGIKLSRIRIGF